MALVSIVNSFSWLLLAGVTYNSVVVSWLIATVLVSGIGVWKISRSIIRQPAWWFWLVLSIVGVTMNWLGSSVLTWSYALGYTPWYPIIGVGYLFSGFYNFDDERLRKLDRLTLIIPGILSILIFLLSFTILSRPNLYFQSLLASPFILFFLTVVPTSLLSVRFGIRAKNEG